MVSTLHVAAAQQPVVEGVGEFLIVPQAHSGPYGLSQKCCQSCCSFWVSATVGEKDIFYLFKIFQHYIPHELRRHPEKKYPSLHGRKFTPIFMYERNVFCLPHRSNLSDIFDLCLHWVSVGGIAYRQVGSTITCLF